MTWSKYTDLNKIRIELNKNNHTSMGNNFASFANLKLLSNPEILNHPETFQNNGTNKANILKDYRGI